MPVTGTAWRGGLAGVGTIAQMVAVVYGLGRAGVRRQRPASEAAAARRIKG